MKIYTFFLVPIFIILLSSCSSKIEVNYVLEPVDQSIPIAQLVDELKARLDNSSYKNYELDSKGNNLYLNAKIKEGIESMYEFKLMFLTKEIEFWHLKRITEKELKLQGVTNESIEDFTIGGNGRDFLVGRTSQRKNFQNIESQLKKMHPKIESDILIWGRYDEQGSNPGYPLYILDKRGQILAPITNQSIEKVEPSVSLYDERPQLSIQLTKAGGEAFSKMTKSAAYSGNAQIAICINGEVISAPRVAQQITGNKSVITGLEEEENHELEIILKAGPLSSKLRILEEEVISQEE